jgi:hypothetical protein
MVPAPEGRQTMAHTFANLLTHVIFSSKQHHRKISFHEEFIALLKAHRIAYDERYIWE